MGYLKDRHGITLVPPEAVPGVCPECGGDHPPEWPHNLYNWQYHYSFYDKHGVWPCWEDAMAHCPEDVKTESRQLLQKLGEDLQSRSETAMIRVSLECVEEESELY